MYGDIGDAYVWVHMHTTYTRLTAFVYVYATFAYVWPFILLCEERIRSKQIQKKTGKKEKTVEKFFFSLRYNEN